MVVISGELATAGSILNFDNMNGSAAPIRFETSIIVSIARPTISPMVYPPLKYPIMLASIPSVKPSISPIIISFSSTLNHSFSFTSSVAIALIISVADCEPMFPPLPISKGMKKASAIAELNVFSNIASTPDENKLTNTSSDNQNILLWYSVNMLACL